MPGLHQPVVATLKILEFFLETTIFELERIELQMERVSVISIGHYRSILA